MHPTPSTRDLFDDDLTPHAPLPHSDDTLGADLADDTNDAPPAGDRWSTWPSLPMLARGPMPYPDWVVTSAAAVDAELGVLKTGKEADVFLVHRFVPDGVAPAPDPALTGPDAHTGAVASLLAAKRYRDDEHRQFHRSAEYREGRRGRKSRDERAVARRTAYGRQVLSARWAQAEFTALGILWEAGLPVPYPVQIDGTELLIEYIGDPDGVAAPRLAQCRPDPSALASLLAQFREVVIGVAALGYTHGDLSAYNILVHHGRLVVIDWPQIVDVVSHSRGMDLLRRDVENVSRWFVSRGMNVDVEDLFGECAAAVVSRW